MEGELFLPESWFAPEKAAERQRLGIPKGRTFATKVELGWRMIERVLERGLLPFEAMTCDTLYGQSGWLRAQLRRGGVVYMAEVPQNTQVYLSPPEVGIPQVLPGQRGRRLTRLQVLSATKPVEVRQVARRADTILCWVRVRTTERGVLEDEFAVRRVWTVYEDKPVEEWLVIRREVNGRLSYALSNAPSEAPLEELAWLKCQRYFVEQVHQDAKSEIGWDELKAQRYQAWEHHLAMTILATWFVAQTKLD